MKNDYGEELVFGLDIGTRSIVGTVGYKNGNRFVVVAQRSKEHDTRAMLDGQIHDIHRVGNTIKCVKEELEQAVGFPLKDVCIAAAGRVLRTVTTHVDQKFDRDKVVSEEDVLSLISMGIEKVYSEFVNSSSEEVKFYCVGHSVIRYYMNGYPMGKLEDHKAGSIGADLIATFLPEDVVDGLYRAVEIADLNVANLTLEPIAAIQVAIPEKFRMLNMALVDVGAGTSDISITQGGSITAYGMIPMAGDSFTELLMQHCLTDFDMAEKIKKDALVKDQIDYVDIMGLNQSITKEEVIKVISPAVSDMTRQVSDCIRSLNGDKSVSAVFVVGGGGKIPGFCELLAEDLKIQKERVALRGEEVMQAIDFLEKDVKKDSLLVTPVGICLSFYEQSNNFIFVSFNEKRIKLYDNTHLTVVDAAIQANFPTDALFPKRGKEIRYSYNGKQTIVRGMVGEAAIITVNGNLSDIHTPIHSNDVIEVKKSTCGADACLELGQLKGIKEGFSVNVNGKSIRLPFICMVNGARKGLDYSIKNSDEINVLDFCDVDELFHYMDLELPEGTVISVNGVPADYGTRIYRDFSVTWEQRKEKVTARAEDSSGNSKNNSEQINSFITVQVNKKTISLKGKKRYVFVDVFDYIDFDLSKPHGSGIVTTLNGRPAQYMEEIHQGDQIEIYWRK